MLTWLKRLFTSGEPAATAERYQLLATRVHRAVLDAGLFAQGLSVAVSRDLVLVCGRVENAAQREEVLSIAKANSGELGVQADLEITGVEYWVGPFLFERMPPAGADRLLAWEAVSSLWSFDREEEDEATDPEDIADFFDAFAEELGVGQLRSFSEEQGHERQPAWHPASAGLQTLDAYFNAGDEVFDAAGIRNDGLPALDDEGWEAVWEVLAAAREALRVAAAHGIRFQFHG